MQTKKWYQSSANPTKISLTIKSLVPFIIFGLGFFGIFSISEADLYKFIEEIFTLVAAFGVVYGTVRKIYYKLRAS